MLKGPWDDLLEAINVKVIEKKTHHKIYLEDAFLIFFQDLVQSFSPHWDSYIFEDLG